jgi:hypothetical protein
VYTICFQVYDLVTRKWLSQNSCATMYLMLNDPPQLNLPANNEQIASTTFPNINFSWTPRHLNATNVSYTFEIKEILNPTLDPAFAFETSNLLYKEEDLRTTNLLYDLSKPTLIPGKKYAWRVKAISTNGLAENNVFKNNGYSQINYFTYASTCEAPRYLLSEQQGSNRVKIMWDGINTQQRYHIQYKKANTPNAEWFDTYTVNTQTLLTNLEPGYTYEFRVGATCEPTQYGITQSYTYSGIQTFAINKNDKATAYNCGIVPTIEIRNQQPLGAMVTNETFMAGDFPVKVLDVQGGNGMFSGSGYIQVPYLADTRIGVTFNNIRINADYQMLDGVVETTYDPNWGNVDFIDDFFNDITNLLKELKDKHKENEAYVIQYENGEISKSDLEEKLITNNQLIEILLGNYNKVIEDLASSDFVSDKEIKQLKDLALSNLYASNTDSISDVQNQIKNSEKSNNEIALILETIAQREETFNAGLSTIYQVIKQGEYSYIHCKECKETASPNGDSSINTIDSNKTLPISIPNKGETYSTKQLKCIIINYTREHNLQISKAPIEAVDFSTLDKNDLDHLKKFLLESIEKQATYVNGNLSECQNQTLEKILDPCSTTEIKVTEQLISALDNCIESGIIETLQELNSEKRDNQEIEFETANGFVYKLNATGVEKIEKPLSAQQIAQGEWTNSNIDVKIRYKFENGILQASALGLRANLAIAQDKEAKLVEISKHLKEQTNKYLNEKKVFNLAVTDLVTSDTFADGKKFDIQGKVIKIIYEGIGLTTTLLKTGEIEEPTYLDDSNATIKAPGVLTGSFEVVAQKVTDITGLVTLAYDLSTDQEVRNALGQQFSDIKKQIGENPKEFVPILGEVVVTALSGNTTDEWQSVLNTSDQGKRGHLATRGTGNTIISAMSGAVLFKKLPDIADNLGENIKKVKEVKKVFKNAKELFNDISKNRKQIRNILNTNAGEAYAKKYFDKFEKGNFEEWYKNTFKKYDLGEPLNFEVHHVIPVNVLEKNKELQELLLWAKKNGKDFDFNSIDNGIPLQKKSSKFDQSGHANHPDYDKKIGKKINEIMGDDNLDLDGKLDEINDLIYNTKQKLEKEVLLGNKDVNHIINF